MDHPLWKDRFEHTRKLQDIVALFPLAWSNTRSKTESCFSATPPAWQNPPQVVASARGSIKFNAFTKNLHRPSDQINSRKKTSRPSPNNLGAL